MKNYLITASSDQLVDQGKFHSHIQPYNLTFTFIVGIDHISSMTETGWFAIDQGTVIERVTRVTLTWACHIWMSWRTK